MQSISLHAGGKIIFATFLLLLCTMLPNAAEAYTNCYCTVGSNGVYVVGLEYTACDTDPPDENKTRIYLVHAVDCRGNTLASYAPYGDTMASSGALTQYYVSLGHRVIRNENGSHILVILNSTYPFIGIAAGLDTSRLPSGQAWLGFGFEGSCSAPGLFCVTGPYNQGPCPVPGTSAP
ncbi:MAG: hypothetical protein P4L42_06745 [Desulfocapsaceae bacterium]|nr:hypothetical protein [Desulfocapsaceae bacterium]